MYNLNCKDEVIIRLIGKISLEFPSLDQLKVRELAEEVLYDYNVTTQEKSLITSDIEDKLQMYLTVKKLDGLSVKTLKNYHYNLIIFANYIRKPIATVNTTDIRIFLANRCKNMKAGTVNGQISILKSFFSWLHNEEYIPKNPMVKIKQTKEPRRFRKALNDEEIEMLIQNCVSDREKALLNFIYSTGCRLSEVVQVDISDIDWNDMSLSVVGKGDKERKVYFNVKTKILLKKYLCTRKDDSKALFVTSKSPFERLGGRSIQREVKKIAKRANIEKNVFPHIIRHTYATHNLNAGMNLITLQHLMGHDDPSTTQIYAKLSQENIKHEYRRIS